MGIRSRRRSKLSVSKKARINSSIVVPSKQVEGAYIQERVESSYEARKSFLQSFVRDLTDSEVKSLFKEIAADRRNPDPGMDPDLELSADWKKGGYPYRNRLSRRSYEKQKYRLQVELLKMQAWVRETGQRIVILFEGRDAAGKGGTIKRFMEHLNPRGARVVALEKPSSVEMGQWYFQRYIQNLPSQGEVVLFDRSWYNRAGVEKVMGFCTEKQYREFMDQVPILEKMLVQSGIKLFKLWFSVTQKEQQLRFKDRKNHPLKQWKLSSVDMASLDKWAHYTQAKEAMFLRTDIDEAP